MVEPGIDMAEDRRLSLNIRVDPSKFTLLENLRQTGFAVAETRRNRSDVYNEVLGLGLQVVMLKNDMGDRDFERLWRLLQKVNFSKLNLEKIEKLVG